MAKKKKQETGKTIWHIREDGSVVPIIQNQQEEIAPVKDTWLKKGALNDSGYAIQNPIDAINRFNASILMTGVDALGQFGKGFLSSAEGVSDIAKTTTADVLDFFGADNKARQLRKSAEDQWGINKELDESLIDDNGFGIDDMSFLGTKGKGVGQGLGTTAFSMTTGAIGGSGVSMGLLGLSAAGNAEQEAIKEMKANQKINGLSDKEIYQQAKLYGLISGTVEAGTEMMFGGLSQGSKLLGIGTGAFDSADDAVINALTKKISNKLVKTFTQAGLKATSEGIEEVLSGLGNAWAKKLTYMKDEDINKLIKDENLLDSFLSGTFSAALSQAPSVARNITTTENGKVRLQTNEEIRDFITNLNEQEQQVVEREIENRLGQEENVSKKRRSEIEKQVIEDLDRGYINANTIRDVLGENYNAERDVRLNESFNEETRRTQAYENDLSKYDEKQAKVIQKAIDSGLLNNSNKTHDFVDLIAKISADKGVDFDFTNNERINESGFGIKGKTVNGYVKDGTINLNLESNQALNKTVGHEITHVLEGTELYNSLQDSLKSFIGEREWNNRISELEKTYKDVKGANIENELTSDLVGEYVFNDESFVKSLSTKNPNLFQKIFDEIKYMVKIATAGSKEARDLEKVKRAFEKAYRETSKTQEGTQYDIEEMGAIENLNNIEGYEVQEDNYPYDEVLGHSFTVKTKEGEANLDIRETKDKVYLNVISTRLGNNQAEKGAGTKILNNLKEYCDKTGKQLVIAGEVDSASGFYDRFDWLVKEKGEIVDDNGNTFDISSNNRVYNPQTKYSLTDNNGNELTKEQQEYFKDSKIRNENGELEVVYHTSPNQFTVFDNTKLGENTEYSNTAFGFFVTPNKNFSQRFGDINQEGTKGNTMEMYANITNPITHPFYAGYKYEGEQLDNIVREYMKATGNEQFISDLEASADEEGLSLYQTYMDMMLGEDPFETADFDREELIKNGYDGIEFVEGLDKDVNYGVGASNEPVSSYAVFDSNQLKNVDNKAPTSNPDIRYSLTDNQGRQLSEQQQEYFKDSKVRDENGRLMEVYHGTDEDFNEFKYGGGEHGDGYYFTEDYDYAEEYSGSREYNDEEGKIVSAYLDLKNPLAQDVDLNSESMQKFMKGIEEKWGLSEQEIKDCFKNYNMDWSSDLSSKVAEKMGYGINDVESTVGFEIDDPEEFGLTDYNAYLGAYAWDNGLNQLARESGFDGIISRIYNADTEGYEYIAFNSNQIKNVDNTNPTDSPDIRYQLGNNEVAPTSGWNVRSEDVRLQSAFKEAIAPLQEQVQELTKTIQNLAPSRALTEEEANEYATQTQEAFENEPAPIRNNLTEEENQRMSILELLERNNMLTDEQRSEMNQLENKINPTYEEEISPVRELSDIRDINEVGKRNVKAYQYEHPEVKSYFQEEARVLLSELDNSTKAERFVTERNDSMYGDWHGIRRNTSPDIAAMLDGELGTNYTYDDIRKGLNAIIEDHGAENIAVAKRIEFVLDERLRNGYEAWSGYTLEDENGEPLRVQPNQDYLNMLAEQEWQNYFDDINSQYPLEQLQEPQYNLEDEETDFSDVSIDNDIQNMTADDINLEPFLQGLVKSSENQAERQQLRNELNEKREVKVPKNPELNKAKNRGLGLLVNEFAEIDDYAKRTGNKDIKFKADTYNNYQAIAQSNIETAQTDINGKRIGRSGNSIFEEAKKYGLEETFDEYLKQWANVDRAKQGKGAANYTASESYKIVKEMEAKNPRLKSLGNDMWQYYRNARHNLRDAGIISQEVSDMLGRMYPHYTPYISEDIENYFTEDGVLKPKSTIKRAKGGAAIGSLLSAEEAMQRYTKSEFNTIFGNDLFKEIVNTSNDIVQLGGDDRGMQFVNADNLYADKTGYYLTAYEDGNPITARISEEMYRTLMRESRNRINDIEQTFSLVTKPLQAASNIRRNILTSWSPTFIAKNFIKDFQEGIFNSKYTKDFIKNYPTAFKELATNTELAQQFKSLYGSGLTMGQFDIDSNNYNPSGKNRNFLKGIKNANELIELAPRFAEFKASIDHGASLQEAMYNAREVTTNFSRGGTLAKALNRNGFTFLNSSIQGFDKFIRNFSGENGAKGIVNSLAKAAIFGIAPAVFNELAFGSGDDKDEEYEALPDYIKDNYYIIKTGDGNFIRIPKGRVLSVFGSAARRTIEAMEGEEKAFEGYLSNVQQQIGINNPEENNIFAPLIQAMGGRKLDSGQTAGSAWYGGDIIPSRLQKERPEDQYDASIDKFSIWLGQQTGISPYKINYVLDQYTGGIGDLGLPMITEEANSDGSLIAPIKDQFTADTITDNKYVSEFYDTKGKLYTGSKATDEDVLKNKYMNSISSEMAKLYAERREVQADTSLTKQQKYAKTQAIKAEINRLAKEGMDNYNNVIMSNNYAKIGDTEYYKNANGQWTKTTDDVASLGLDTEEKSEYYKVKNDIYTTKKNNDGNDKPLVMQDIINSNLTPDAKVNLYTSNYKDDLIQPLVDSGMDVDSYLTFKAQNFTADKDSNGKSISGSKKQKVFNYINSMSVPYEQKLILAKSEYNSFNDNNYEIIEYIENSGMDYDERIQLYKSLGFKVDGDNISW